MRADNEQVPDEDSECPPGGDPSTSVPLVTVQCDGKSGRRVLLVGSGKPLTPSPRPCDGKRKLSQVTLARGMICSPSRLHP